MTLENASPIDAEEKILNEQKLELTMGILKQSLRKQGGSLQTRKQDQSFWLQIALSLGDMSVNTEPLEHTMECAAAVRECGPSQFPGNLPGPAFINPAPDHLPEASAF
ncbi:MAG: hypothetical protein M3Q07_10050 [Pseudobdellovibrionaceae bacterium]|nr:hypothetical protein [Pseudobdellovibrionaceae bacterium]